ncbi:MAG: hypothetical protein LBR25_00475 [Erysipelotrichaceae bacterium]|jgi:hypothetical protein|nr:hypothetical protein [Erysipelotrichaceae bacterium]
MGKPEPNNTYVCPDCQKAVTAEMQHCPGCGRLLWIVCPGCGMKTRAYKHCEFCGVLLYIRCHRCNKPVYFDNQYCANCAQKVKDRYRILHHPLKDNA